MAGEKWTFGIKQVLSGPHGALGVLGNALTEHGETLKGSATLETSDETINWIETEEKGKRKSLNQNDAETTLTFEVANPSLATMAYYCGGEVKTDQAGKDFYAPPKTKDPLNLSFKVVTKEGFDIEIPFGGVTATPLGGQIGSENVLTLKVVVTAQLPEDPLTGHLYYRAKD